MDENNLRAVLRELRIPATGRISTKGWIAFPCPVAQWYHRGGKDKSPSAAAKADPAGRSTWACQACKQHGSIHSLAVLLMTHRAGVLDEALLSRIDTAETGVLLHVAEFGCEAVEPVAPKPLDEDAVDGIYPPAWEDPASRDYLQGRGVGQETSERIGLVFDPEKRRILFPIRDRTGALFGFTGRAIYQNPRPKILDYHFDKRHFILGEHLWRPGFPKIIVEGLFGYAHLIQEGVDAFADVGALLGSVLTPEKAERIKSWGDPTHLMLDNDEGGDLGLFGRRDEKGRHRFQEGAVAALMNHVIVFVPDWPSREDGSQKEDPDELTYAEVEKMLQSWPYVVPPEFREKKWTK